MAIRRNIAIKEPVMREGEVRHKIMLCAISTMTTTMMVIMSMMMIIIITL